MSKYYTALINYLKPELPSKNRAPLREELLDYIRSTEKEDSRLLMQLIELGDVEILEAYLDIHGQDRLGEMKRGVGSDTQCPLFLITTKDRDEQQCVRLLEIIFPYISAERESALYEAFNLAEDLESKSFFDAVMRLFQPQKLEALGALMKGPLQDGQKVKLPKPIADLLSGSFDRKDPDWDKVIQDAVKWQCFKAVAVAMKMGVNVAAIIEKINYGGSGEWYNRIPARMHSAHARMELMASLPSLEDILEMEKEELLLLIAGPNGRQRRKVERAAKRAKNKEGWEKHKAAQAASA